MNARSRLTTIAAAVAASLGSPAYASDLDVSLRDTLADYREACSAHDDELTRLREQVETMRRALEYISKLPNSPVDPDNGAEETVTDAPHRARAALEAKE